MLIYDLIAQLLYFFAIVFSWIATFSMMEYLYLFAVTLVILSVYWMGKGVHALLKDKK